MLSSDILAITEVLVEAYRSLLLLDPFIKITIEMAAGDYISECLPGRAALSWIIRLNPDKHDSQEDIQYSVIDGLLYIILSSLDLAVNPDDKYNKVKKEVISRLCSSLANIMPIEELFVQDEVSA